MIDKHEYMRQGLLRDLAALDIIVPADFDLPGEQLSILWCSVKTRVTAMLKGKLAKHRRPKQKSATELLEPCHN